MVNIRSKLHDAEQQVMVLQQELAVAKASAESAAADRMPSVANRPYAHNTLLKSSLDDSQAIKDLLIQLSVQVHMILTYHTIQLSLHIQVVAPYSISNMLYTLVTHRKRKQKTSWRSRRVWKTK